MTSFF